MEMLWSCLEVLLSKELPIMIHVGRALFLEFIKSINLQMN